MTPRTPLIGLMLGDVTGIGPEISAKLLASGAPARANARVAVIGDARVLALGARDAAVELAWCAYERIEAIDWTKPEMPLIDLGNVGGRQAHRLPPPKMPMTCASGLACGAATGRVASFIAQTVSGRLCSSISVPDLSKAHSMSCGLP